MNDIYLNRNLRFYFLKYGKIEGNFPFTIAKKLTTIFNIPTYIELQKYYSKLIFFIDKYNMSNKIIYVYIYKEKKRNTWNYSDYSNTANYFWVTQPY